MKIVADTNIFLAVALSEPEKTRIIELSLNHELLAPEVLPFEVGNALSAMLKKRALDSDDVVDAWDAVSRIPVELRQIDIRESLKLSRRLKIYAYDAYFLDCALSTRSPLLTLDRRLKSVAAEAGVTILE